MQRLGGQQCIGYGHPGWFGVENLCMRAGLVVVRPREKYIWEREADGEYEGDVEVFES